MFSAWSTSRSLCPGDDNRVCVCVCVLSTGCAKAVGSVMCEMVRKVMQEISDIISLVDVNVCIKGVDGSSEECQTTLTQLASFILNISMQTCHNVAK